MVKTVRGLFRHIRLNSIRTRINIAFLLISFILLFVITSVFNYIYSNVMIDRSIQNYINTLGLISMNIESLTESIENYSKMIITSQDTQTLLGEDYRDNTLKELVDSSKVKGTFVNIVGRKNTVNSIFILKLGNMEIYDIGNASNITLENILQKSVVEQYMKKDNVSTWTDVYLSDYKVMNKQRMVFSHYESMMDMNTGYIEGVLCINVNEEAISSIFSKISRNSSGKYFIVNKKGIVMSSSDRSDVLKDISKEPYYKWCSSKKDAGIMQNINGKNMLVTTAAIGKLGWRIINFVPYEDIKVDSSRINLPLVVIGAALFLVAIIASIIISGRISKPLSDLSNIMANSGRDADLSLRVRKTSNDEVGILQASFNSMMFRISELIEVVKQEQKQKREYELASITAQIRPHFLYNAINSTCGLLMIKEYENALKMLKALGEYYKVSLSKGRELIKLHEEVKLTESYIIIQKSKYGDMLEYEVSLDERVRNCLIPKFTIQPLVENSFKHAFDNIRGKKRIEIGCLAEGENVIITVCDNGMGGDPELINSLFEADLPGSKPGFGLGSIYGRLRLYFEDGFSMKAEAADENGLRLIISIPAKNED